MSRRFRELGLAMALFAILIGGCDDTGKVRHVDAIARFDASLLDFGEVPVGEWREAPITVMNASKVPFRVSEALQLDKHPAFYIDANTDARVPPFGSRDVIVRFHPIAEGAASDRVQVEVDATNRPDSPIVELRGVGVPTPIQFEPPALDFETLEIESDRTLEVTITNPVDLPLVLQLRGDAAAEFGAELASIPPNGRTTLKTRFAPTALGERLAQIEVRSCETCTPSQVGLRGLSVPHAFQFTPDPMPFQPTPMHSTTRSHTNVTNITWRPVTVRELVPDDAAFLPLTELRGRLLQPGEGVQLDMQFGPRFANQAGGSLAIRYDSDRAREAVLALDATGGSPQLALTPIDIDFGRLPVGGKVERVVRLTNAGTKGNLHLLGARGEGAWEQFSIGVPVDPAAAPTPWLPEPLWPVRVAPNVPIAPGADYRDVRVFFNPTAPGLFEGQVVFVSDDLFNPERVVRVRGEAWDAGTCQGHIVPLPNLDFGNVPAGEWAILGFRFENMGVDVCAVKDIRLSNDGGGVFSMPGGELTGGVVLQADAFSAMIAFHTTTPGAFEGELELFVNNPENPRIALPITAISAESCLSASPTPLDFGPIRFDCAPVPRTTFVSNHCPAPVTVNNLWIGAGTSDQFAIATAPPVPLELQPGEGFEVEVSYARTILGQHYSPLYVGVPGDPAPYVVPMWAETNHVGTTTDRFVQGTANQLDVLFVVSNSTTMGAFQQRLADDIPGWIAAAEGAGLSLQVGVTTTGLVERGTCTPPTMGAEAGRLVPADGSRARVVPGVTGQVATLQQNVRPGACHNLVQGLETMRMALSPPLITGADDPRSTLPNDGNLGFLRPSARLAVIFVADEDDNSGFSPDTYIQFLRNLKGPSMSHRVQAWAIVPDGSCTTAGPSGARFAAVAQGTGGAIASVCSGSYDGLLSQASGRASGPQADFRLSFPVRAAEDITVTVDGQVVPPGEWSYDPATHTVVFAPWAVPSQGQTIEVSYVGDCSVVTQ